jgi:hypothetical protein
MERDHKVAIIRLKSSSLTECYSFVIQLSLTFRSASSIAGSWGINRRAWGGRVICITSRPASIRHDRFPPEAVHRQLRHHGRRRDPLEL